MLKMLVLNGLFFLIVTGMVPVTIQTTPVVVTATPGCPAMSNVELIPARPGQSPFSLNVRSEPGGTSVLLGSFTEKDGVQRVVEARTMPDGRNFLKLKDGSLGIPQGGWIIARYLLIVCDPVVIP